MDRLLQSPLNQWREKATKMTESNHACNILYTHEMQTFHTYQRTHMQLCSGT